MNWFKNEIEVELFTIQRSDVLPFVDVLLTTGDVKLRYRKIIHLNSDRSENSLNPIQLFTYSFTKTYFDRFSKKINTQIHFVGYTASYFHYAHLTWWQQIKLSWMFKQTFIQKHENIKWIIGMVVTFIIGFILAKIKCKC